MLAAEDAAVDAVQANAVPSDDIATSAASEQPVVEARRDSGPRRPLARPFDPELRVERAPRVRTTRQIAAVRAPNAIEANAVPAAAPTAPIGDFNNDSKVDRADLAVVAGNFGLTDAAFADGDLTGDGAVSLADLVAMRLGPGQFNILAPLGNSADTTPDVAWTLSPGAVRYDAAIESAPGCTGESIIASTTAIAETQFTFDALADGAYYLCVRAYDEFGNATDATNNAAASTIATQPSGSLAIEMIASRTSVSAAGQAITFTYTITNTSSTTLANVSLTNMLAVTPTRQTDEFGDNDDELEPEEIWRYTATYTVTQADLNTGRDVTNVATADSDQSPAATDDAVIYNLFALPNLTVGDVLIRPIDHASFVVTHEGVTIYVDSVGGASLYTGLPKADLILISHSHGDHYSASTLAAVSDSETRFITPQSIFSRSDFATYRPRTTVLAYGQTTNVLGVSVEAVHAYNDRHALNEGNGYIFTVDDTRLYAAGDTGPVPEIRALEDIDVAFLCMNVPFTMNVDEAASVTRDMQPTIVIPYHYRNNGGTFADLGRFKSLVGQDLPIEVRLLDWY
jgi:L-ascorbate metabolism protein UlaG (beta-lactamase superfamily)